MDTERTGSYEPGSIASPPAAPAADRVITDTTYVAPVRRESVIETGENFMPVRNRVQWGPILSGLVSAITTMVLMTVLGIAIGASVLEPTVTGEQVGTWAALWGAISAIVSFFVGGLIAAKTAAVDGSFSGLMNGLMVGAAGILLILWMTSMGLGNLFGTLSANIGDLATVAQDAAQQQGVAPSDVQAQAGEAQEQVQQAAQGAEQAVGSSFDEIRAGAFGTFLGLLVPLVAAALGGFFGHNKREELLRGTG